MLFTESESIPIFFKALSVEMRSYGAQFIVMDSLNKKLTN